MQTSAVDVPALLVAVFISVLIASALLFAQRGYPRRIFWVTAGALALALIGAGYADLSRDPLGETPMAAVIIGAVLPVAGCVGALRASRRLPWWAQWLIMFAAALLLLFVGLLVGATLIPRLVGS